MRPRASYLAPTHSGSGWAQRPTQVLALVFFRVLGGRFPDILADVAYNELVEVVAEGAAASIETVAL